MFGGFDVAPPGSTTHQNTVKEVIFQNEYCYFTHTHTHDHKTLIKLTRCFLWVTALQTSDSSQRNPGTSTTWRPPCCFGTGAKRRLSDNEESVTLTAERPERGGRAPTSRPLWLLGTFSIILSHLIPTQAETTNTSVGGRIAETFSTEDVGEAPWLWHILWNINAFYTSCTCYFHESALNVKLQYFHGKGFKRYNRGTQHLYKKHFSKILKHKKLYPSPLGDLNHVHRPTDSEYLWVHWLNTVIFLSHAQLLLNAVFFHCLYFNLRI